MAASKMKLSIELSPEGGLDVQANTPMSVLEMIGLLQVAQAEVMRSASANGIEKE